MNTAPLRVGPGRGTMGAAPVSDDPHVTRQIVSRRNGEISV